jgi:hypothetical protein
MGINNSKRKRIAPGKDREKEAVTKFLTLMNKKLIPK